MATVTEGFSWRSLAIPEVIIFKAEPHRDIRGHVMPVYSRSFFHDIGINTEFVMENHVHTTHPFTVRGFHYQAPPFEQPKLIRVNKGTILDVNIDIRQDSPTYGQHVSIELTANEWNQIYVPGGFAHCLMTLTEDTEIVFKLGCEFAPDAAFGFAWNDADLGIEWPVGPNKAIVLDRDMDRPKFSELHPNAHATGLSE